MKKDLQSYKKHNIDFNSDSNNLENTREVIKNYEKVDQFKVLGFELAISMSNPLPKVHVDIGSGNGWLLNKTSTFFEKVVGIEPSEKAIDLAKEVNKNNNNVSFINKDMVDGLNTMNTSIPIFVTSATVLNHIENFYVEEFLKKINVLPIGSVIFFDERYDKNIDWNMWHVRSKDWWIKNLSNWQIIFLNFDVAGYPSGIYGKMVGKDNVVQMYTMSFAESFLWKVSGIYRIALRAIRKLKKIVLE